MTNTSTALVAGGFQDWEEEDQGQFDRANQASQATENLKLRDNAKNRIRILPPLRLKDENQPSGYFQMKSPTVEFYQHFYDFPGDAQKKVVFVCPKHTPTVRKPCPCCEQLEGMIAERGKPAFGSPDANLQYNRKAKRVLVCNAIDCDLPEAGVRKFSYNPRTSTKKGPGVHELLEELRLKDGIKYWHPVEGRNLCIEKTKGSGDFDVAYALVRKEFVACPIEEIGDFLHTAEEWAAMAFDLRLEAVAPSYDDCRLIMQGKDPRRPEDEDEEAVAPRPAAARRARNAQSRIEEPI